MSETAVIKTSEGDMILELWADVAPGHVENFKKLAQKGYYDGTCFHRVIKGFMIQGGDPMGTARKFDDANPSVVYTDMTEHSPTEKDLKADTPDAKG